MPSSRMEEEALCRRSVAELVGRFKGSTHHQDATGQELENPVRRRPPCSLKLPKTQVDEQEPPGVTSPQPSKAKRNSALIEKLQANLALSPGALMASPKSPGFKMFPPAFPLPSPGSASGTVVTSSSPQTPTSPVPTSPLTEEGPASFEEPPVVGEGSTLSNTSIKGRARHSLRRRPPSRRHRKPSSGEDISNANEGGDVSHSANEEGRGGEDQKDGLINEVKEDIREVLISHTETKTYEEEKAAVKHSTGEEGEENEQIKNGSPEGEDRSSEIKVEEEKKIIQRQDDVGRGEEDED
ncbi:duboraya [Takifugu flavidus]|uniref:CapZ-interacting protein n=1 Tax=Takifugu flavidus TaxID=433684 RepID=A0A5C6P586_9TELE|nr:duboraya [Takifugu flavidus]XP_056909398.1 duboraya [Takifugu flavidus]TWW74525.1 CapZ-interacting protein [Takifugu flavidus]